MALSLSNLTNSYVPILESKDKENQKVKKILRERVDIRNDDDLLKVDLYGHLRGAADPQKR